MHADVVKVLKEGSKSDNKRLTNNEVTLEWNKRVHGMLETAATQAERDKIGAELGYQLERSVERLANKMSRRVLQVSIREEMQGALIKFHSRVKSMGRAVPTKLRASPAAASVSATSTALPAASTAAELVVVPAPSARTLQDVRLKLNINTYDKLRVCLACYMDGRAMNKCYAFSMPNATRVDGDGNISAELILSAVADKRHRVTFLNGHTKAGGDGASIACPHPHPPSSPNQTDLSKERNSLRRKLSRIKQSKAKASS